MKAFTKKQKAKMIKKRIRKALIKAEATMLKIMVSMAVAFTVSSILFLTYDSEFNSIAKTLYLTVTFVVSVLAYIEINLIRDCVILRKRRIKSRV